MKKRDWVQIFGLFILTLLLDQYTKFWASSKPESWHGILHLITVHNHGAMLGLFSNLTAFLRVVLLSTSGIFILSIYFFLQYIIPIPILKLRYGLSILVGGILGNVIDRIVHGYVIDFISIAIGQWHSPIWNVADMIQWVGYFLIAYTLVKEGQLLWPDKNARSKFWINQRFQIKFAAVFISIGLALTLITFVFSYTYIKLSLTEIVGTNQELLNKYLTTFVFSFFALFAVFSMTLFAISKRISHQIAGPVFAFERFLTDVLDEKNYKNSNLKLKLRAGDDFKHLEVVAENIKIKIQNIQTNQQSNS